VIQAAGILIVCGGKALFLLRGPGSDHPYEWCFPGGQREEETLEQCAIRETIEECGLQVEPDDLVQLARSIARAEPQPLDGEGIIQSDDVDFTTFLTKIDAEFTPVLCDEHVGYAWCDLEHGPAPMHPGARIAVARLGMDELGVARAMMAGDLASPQTYHNMVLYDMRITGTGKSFRSKINEHVWRPPEEYLNDEFLARVNGLPVIWIHPEEDLLNSEQFSKRIVGTVMLPYIKGDEVWGIVRVYDAETIDALEDDKYSTSPGVLVGGKRLKNDKGDKILFESKPMLIDHLAIVPRGVWDKGGEPSGVEAVNVEADAVVDSEPDLDYDRLGSLQLQMALLKARFSAISTLR
jgi:8-oxo-dGTP pyrophosphatase MutT (NUDIX family)